jgi:hypothetical protein
MKKVLVGVLVMVLSAALALPAIIIAAPDSDIEINIDIKPNSCPNSINVKSGGVLPVAILGTDTFDVANVDPETVLLEGIAPLRWSYEDVATPFGDELVDCSSCTVEGPDGFVDLTLKFDKQELIAALGEVEDGECLIVTLTGELIDVTTLSGSNIVRIIKKIKNGEESVTEQGEGKAKGKETAPGQIKEPGTSAEGKAKGKETAPGQIKEPGTSAVGKAKGKETAPGQIKEPSESAVGKGKNK